MIANYHTHTARCGHAVGEDREYVERALERGLKILGFSDHIPMPFRDGHESRFRVPLARLEDYVRSVLDLRAEYEKEIRILLGFESEYYPDYEEALAELLAPYPVDFRILGQHFNDSSESLYNPVPQESRERLSFYVDRVLEGLATGNFLYAAHPDLIHFTGEEAFFRQEMTRLCRGARLLDIPLELNILGMREGRNYPDPLFWEIAARERNRVILGCDAHTPEDVAHPAQLKEARAFAAKYGLLLINEINEEAR